MKAIMPCIFFLAVLGWSNIITLTGTLAFEAGYLNIDTTKTCDVDTTYINCSMEDGLAYYSTLDTSIAVFFQPRYASGFVTALSPYTSTVNHTHSYTEVMRYEFMNWVDWGIIVMEKDSAQRLLDRVLPESQPLESCIVFHRSACDDDPLQCDSFGTAIRCYGGGGNDGISDETAARLPTKKILINQTDSSATPSISGQPADTVSIEDTSLQALFPVQKPVALGGRYSVFDMNGVFLYQDFWQGNLKAQGKPVIVRFSNGETRIFK
ncbi:MAG: hypothetical protein HUK21_09445 [Fibrobacteraceae bacterium]|nr:hypothetical protein [Fibrobacteraceae bacterium]